MTNKIKKRMTIDDIARLAGVSPTAVSFVLNGKDGIGAATREKVNAVIKATGYQPNASSIRLSTRKSFNIALIYPASASPFSDLYYYEIARGLTEHISLAGYNVVFVNLEQSNKGNLLPRIILRHDADGAVLLQEMDPSFLSSLEQSNVPFVIVDTHAPAEAHTHVSVDSEKSIYTAVSYLIAQGHSKIAFLGIDRLPSYYLRCLAGYKKALDHHNLSIHPAWLQKTSDDEQSLVDSIEAILECPDRPTSVCCMGDIHAIKAMNIVKSRGISVPDDLSFISIDDILLSCYVEPPLTTIGYDKLEMGKIAAELLLKKIADKPVESVIVNSDTLIERCSVKSLL